MNTEFSVRDRSGTAGDNESRSPDGHLSPPPRNPRGLRAGTGSPDPARDTPLRAWLNDLAHRRCTITVENHVIHIHGARAADTDRHHVNRNRHALELAANGTHPAWWRWVTGHHDTVPDWDDIPWTCASCGTDDIDVLDPDLLAWCEVHA